MSLADIALRALKPSDKPGTVSDTRGLYVEVFPTGGVIWRYRYRLGGKLAKLTLGKYPALTLKAARLKRDEASHAVAAGDSPAQQVPNSSRNAASCCSSGLISSTGWRSPRLRCRPGCRRQPDPGPLPAL